MIHKEKFWNIKHEINLKFWQDKEAGDDPDVDEVMKVCCS